MTSPAEGRPATFRSMTLGNAIRAARQRHPSKQAIVHAGRTRTFAELAERADRLRDAAIGTLGLVPGDRVALVARNCIEFIEVVCGVPDAGVAVATLNPRLVAAELRVAIEDADPRVVITDAASTPVVREAAPHLRIVEIGPQYEALLADALRPTSLPTVEEWHPWTICYTSGTTGKPKGVVLSHRSRMLVGLICSAEFGCFGPDDRFLAMSPMNHGAGLGFPVGVLAAGGSIEILDQFEPALVLERLKHGGITGVFMVPTHFQMIFALPEETLAKFRAPPIKTILANAAPLPQSMKERIIPYFGATVLHELYGATETGLVCNLRPQYQLQKERCVGTPFPHVEAEVRRNDGTICDADEVGELWSRSPILFSGYWNQPEATAAAAQDGWVSVGDLARRDVEGYLYIVDRKKDMVISGGVNVYPREIEEALLSHPAVADIAVIGVPDELWGERLKAFVVARPDRTVTLVDVQTHCATRLSSYKIPKELELIDALPRNANGKVLKAELKARA